MSETKPVSDSALELVRAFELESAHKNVMRMSINAMMGMLTETEYQQQIQSADLLDYTDFAVHVAAVYDQYFTVEERVTLCDFLKTRAGKAWIYMSVVGAEDMAAAVNAWAAKQIYGRA